jgi:hypothetical protein
MTLTATDLYQMGREAFDAGIKAPALDARLTPVLRQARTASAYIPLVDAWLDGWRERYNAGQTWLVAGEGR